MLKKIEAFTGKKSCATFPKGIPHAPNRKLATKTKIFSIYYAKHKNSIKATVTIKKVGKLTGLYNTFSIFRIGLFDTQKHKRLQRRPRNCITGKWQFEAAAALNGKKFNWFINFEISQIFHSSSNNATRKHLEQNRIFPLNFMFNRRK